MKKIILLFVILFMFVKTKSQEFSTEVEARYFLNSYKFSVLEFPVVYDIWNSKYEFKINLNFSYKNISIYQNQSVLCSYFNKKGYSFVPCYAFWYTGIKYSFKNTIELGYEHHCFHKIFENHVYNIDLIAGGGYDALFLKFKFISNK